MLTERAQFVTQTLNLVDVLMWCLLITTMTQGCKQTTFSRADFIFNQSLEEFTVQGKSYATLIDEFFVPPPQGQGKV